MANSARATRRAAPTASQRHLRAARSRPVAWLIGGIAGAFAIAIAFILLGGPPPDAGLEERVAALESEAARLADPKPEEAIKIYETLLSIAGGERWRVKQAEWRAAIKALKGEIQLLKEARAKLAAWEKAAGAASSADARALLEEGHRLKDAYSRIWALDPLLSRLRELLPKPPPTWQAKDRSIADARKLDRRGEAEWGAAKKDWTDYMATPGLGEADRAGAERALATLERRAREEVVSLIKKAATPDELKRHRLRFDGTAAAVELEKALQPR